MVTLSSLKLIKLRLDILSIICYNYSVGFVNRLLPSFYWDAVHMVWKMF